MSENGTTGARCAWIHYARPRPHWYLVSPAEQDALRASWDKIADAARDGGATCAGTFHVRGQHDFETVAVWTFADSRSAYLHWQTLVDARYSEFFAFSNNIGLELADAGHG